MIIFVSWMWVIHPLSFRVLRPILWKSLHKMSQILRDNSNDYDRQNKWQSNCRYGKLAQTLHRMYKSSEARQYQPGCLFALHTSFLHVAAFAFGSSVEVPPATRECENYGFDNCFSNLDTASRYRLFHGYLTSTLQRLWYARKICDTFM